MSLGRATTQDATFDLAFEMHHNYVYRLAHALLGNPQDAEDVTQEVFIRVYKALPSYQSERASFRTWLTQIAVNACQTQRRKNVLRQLWRHATRPEDAEDHPALADGSAWGMPESQALQAELRQDMRGILDGLRAEHRTVLVLHYYLDLSCAEIARILACPEGTVYSRLHYARRLIQAQLESRALRPLSEVRT